MSSTGGSAAAGPPVPRAWWPAGFTINQGAVGEHVLDSLCAVARAKDAPPAERAALGSLMQTLPHRDHAAEATCFTRYWLYGAGEDKPLRDVVRAYRSWLEREP